MSELFAIQDKATLSVERLDTGRRTPAAALVLLSLIVTSCGGGGGGSAASTPPSPPPVTNQPPDLTVSETLDTDEDIEATITLIVSDVDSTDLAIEFVSLPLDGTVGLDSTGNSALTYTPDEHFNGSDEFSLRAFDGQSYSATATVSVTVRPIDDPPVIQIADVGAIAALDVIELRAEILDVDGDGDTADPLGWALPDFSANGFLWSEEIDAFSVRARAPSFANPVTLDVEFSARALDGTVLREVLSLSVSAGSDIDGDGHSDLRDTDDDADGWADFVERQLGTDPSSPESMPSEGDPRIADIDIYLDSDDDGIPDIQEEILYRDPFDANSVPPDSNADGWPDFARHLTFGRGLPFGLPVGLPLIVAAELHETTFDVGDGTESLQVTFTAVSPVPITDIELTMQIIEVNTDRTLLQFFDRGQFTINTPSTVLAGTIRMPLNQYFPESDFRVGFVGNSVGFDYRGQPNDPLLQQFLDLMEGAWASGNTITIQNSGVVDNTRPTVTDLVLRNDVIDVSSDVRALTYDLVLEDDLSGVQIHQLRVTKGARLNIVSATDIARQTRETRVLDYTGTTGNFSRDFSIDGLGGIDFLITDYAGNELILFPDDLLDLGLPYFVDLRNSAPDSNIPVLENLEVLTPTVSRAAGHRVDLLFGASDLETGISEIWAEFVSDADYTISEISAIEIGRRFEVGEETVDVIVTSEPLGRHVHTGTYELHRLIITDQNDRRLELGREAIIGLGINVRFDVTL